MLNIIDFRNVKHTFSSIVLLNKNVIILYSYDELDSFTSPKDFENIECYDENNRLLWRVHGMGDHNGCKMEEDTFVGFVKDKNDTLYAITFAGSKYILDVDTGKVTYDSWTK